MIVPAALRFAQRETRLVIVSSCRTILAGLVLIICSVTAAWAASAVPQHAREPFERGLAAAAQNQWLIAIREFQDAQRLAPDAAPILFNLGLAHSRAGNEMAAVAWLNAYLVAAPDDPRASTIRSDIARLEVATEVKIQKIVQEAAEVLSKFASAYPITRETEGKAFGVTWAVASAGHLTLARKIAAHLGTGPPYDRRGFAEREALERYLRALGKRREFDEAAQLLDRAERDGFSPDRDAIWSWAAFFWRPYNADIARQAAGRIQDSAKKRADLEEISEAQSGYRSTVPLLDHWVWEAKKISGLREVIDSAEFLDETAGRGVSLKALEKAGLIAAELYDSLATVRALERACIAKDRKCKSHA